MKIVRGIGGDAGCACTCIAANNATIKTLRSADPVLRITCISLKIKEMQPESKCCPVSNASKTK
jgi:hypothetical protein